MKSIAVDPRAWNIVAGLCVVSGCGANTSEGGETTESSTSTTLETGGLECNADAECDALQICDNGYCAGVLAPHVEEQSEGYSECCDESLAVSFADVDADGAMEQVVANPSTLVVFESDLSPGNSSPRGLDSDSVDAMAGGPFDAMAGDDVMILLADELHLHGSDGMSNFGMPTTSPTSWPDNLGLVAGEFDGQAPADLLIWGNSGAGVRLGSGDEFPLGDGSAWAATARSLDEPVGGFMLQRVQMLEFYTLAGEPLASSQSRADPPYTVTSIEHLGESFDLSSSVIAQEWTLIEVWDPATGNLDGQWGLVGQVKAMAGGDFDGDARGDVALIVDGSLQIGYEAHNPNYLRLYPMFSGIVTLAVGDFDGDGDDEISIHSQDGLVRTVHGE